MVDLYQHPAESQGFKHIHSHDQEVYNYIYIYIYKFPWVTDRYIICLTKSYFGLKKYIVWVSNLQPFVGHDFHVLRQAIAQAIIIDGSLG